MMFGSIETAVEKINTSIYICVGYIILCSGFISSQDTLYFVVSNPKY